MSNQDLAFLTGRLALGINFFAHGIIRLPKMEVFCEGMVKKFQDTPIGFDPLIYGFAYSLVIIELLVGFTLILGYKTRTSLVVTNVVMMSLIFGASMQENWSLVGSQMIYVIFIYLMILGYTKTKYSMDHWLSRKN